MTRSATAPVTTRSTHRHPTRSMQRLRTTLHHLAVATGAAAAFALGGLPATALAADESSPQSVLDGPTGEIKYSTPTFTFSSNEAGVTFECQVDGGEWKVCGSPWTVTLADGDHSLAVRAIDEAGNADPSPAVRELSVDTSGVDTAIDGGPSGLTNDATPSFAFSTPVTAATYECRIVGDGSPLPGWAGCSSPFTTPELPSNAFRFEVRAVSPAGRADSTPSRRDFTVDAIAPDTELTDGPPEGGDSASRTPRFGYRSEPGARFECRVDPKSKQGVDLVAWAPCDPSGFTAPLLRGGAHSFEVRATDVAGNADPTPAKRNFRVVACEKLVRFGLVELRGECLQGAGTDEAPAWESEKPFTLNGLPVPVLPGTTAVIKESVGESDGLLTIKNITLAPAGVQLYKGDLSLKLPAGKQGEEKEAMAFSPGGKLFGMQVAGKAAFRLGWPNGTDQRRAVLTLSIALPDIFKAGPGKTATSVTGDVGIRMDPVSGVQLDGVKVQVGNAFIGGLGIKSLCLSYLRGGSTFVAGCQAPSLGKAAAGKPPFMTCATDTDKDRWDGALAIILPTASKTELGVWGGTSDGKFSHGGAYADNLGTALPLAPGVFVDRIAFGVCVQPPPFKLKGEIGVAFGPDFNGHKAAKVNGWLEYTDSYNGSPWQVRAGGSLELFEREMANAEFSYLSSGMIDFKFHAGYDFKVASINGDVEGWVETVGSKRFNVEGSVRVCADLIGCAQGQALVSSVGLAGCVTVKGRFVDLTGGLGYTWKNGKIKLMGGSCSLGEWRAQRAVAARLDASGKRLQAAPQTLVVPKGTPGIAVRVRGQGGVPKVAFVGPDGRRITTDVAPGQGLVQGSHMLMDDDEAGEVSALIVEPAAGTWTVEPLPGSVPIASVDTADAMPSASVKARVTAGKTSRERVLRYSYVPADGRTVSFSEQGPRTARTIGSAKKTGRCKAASDRRAGRVCGELRFTPADGGRGKRDIRAEVRQGTAGAESEGREAAVVASFIAPADALPPRPKLTVRRGAGSITARWKKVAGANQINVVFATADGRRVLFTRDATKGGSVRLTGVRAAVAVRVTARGMRLDTREGRATTKTVKPKKAAKKKAGR